MSHKIHFIIIALAIFMTLFGLFSVVNIAKANPSFFIRNSGTSATRCSLTATTSVRYMTAGTATTTVILNSTGCGGSQAIDSAALMLYRNAAAASSKTRIAIEYSDDCDAATGGTWYAPAATSTDMALNVDGGLTSLNAMVWQFASTTVGGSIEKASSDSLLIPIMTPTKCVRAVLTVPTGSASSSLWASFVGKRQTTY